MQVIITPKAEKQYNQLPQSEKIKVKKKIKILEVDPYFGKKLSGELSDLRSFRAWPYRIFYHIDLNKKIIFIIGILHRQGAYK